MHGIIWPSLYPDTPISPSPSPQKGFRSFRSGIALKGGMESTDIKAKVLIENHKSSQQERQEKNVNQQ